jgi:hypothetical protein
MNPGSIFSKIAFLLLIPAGLFLFSSCKKDNNSPTASGVELLIHLRHVAMGAGLAGKDALEDSSGTLLRFSKLQYYLSGFRLETENPMETYALPGAVYLVKGLDNGGETTITLKGIPGRVYKNLVFHIGLDSITNRSRGGTGALDPGNGMYWSWSGEYKFMVLEGNYQAGDSAGAFLFHLTGQPCYRSFRIPLLDTAGKELDIREGGEIRLDAEISALFGAPHPVDFKQMNNVMSLEAGAGKIADNYSYGRFFRLRGK